MNPAESLAAIGCLPSRATYSIASARGSGAVATVRTTSTRGIRGTGLKKCRPRNRSGRPVTRAIAMIDRLDVLEAKIVAGGLSLSSAVHSWVLSSRYSRRPGSVDVPSS